MLEVVFDAVDALFTIRKARIELALQRPFSASLLVRSQDENLDPRALLGVQARLVATPPLAEPFVWSGVCSSARFIEAEPSGLSTFEVVIASPLWLLSQRQTCRVFQRLTAPAIAERIATEWSLTPRLELAEDHAVLDHRVQYNETDLAFFTRTLEEGGLSYALAPSSRPGPHVIISDDPARGAAVRPPIPFAHDNSTFAERPLATAAQRVERLASDSLSLRDYDFRHPSFDLLVQTGAPRSRLEHHTHAPESAVIVKGPPVASPQFDRGEVRADRSALQRLAERTLDALRSSRTEISLSTNQVHLVPGDVFSLADHPRRDLAPDAPLLVLSATVEYDTPGAWRSTLTAFPAAEGYRPPRSTPKPRTFGVQSATVVGLAGQEIHTDEHGRVRLHFPWDREGERHDESSCWVRVSQAWAGGGFGSFGLPRVGDEVLVSFLDGDPDHPVVVGRLHNGARALPFRLPEEKALSGIRTRSTPGGQGYNELVFDDREGEERVSIRAERTLESVVVQDRIDRTNRDATTIVGGAITTTVTGAETRWIGGAATTTIGGALFEHIAGSSSLVQGPRAARITGGDQLTVSESVTVKAGAGVRIIAGTSGIDDAVLQASGTTRVAGGRGLRLVSPATIELVCGSSRISITPDKIILKAKEIVAQGEDSVTLAKGDATLLLDGKLKVGASEIELASDQALLALKSDAELKGAKVKIASSSSASRSAESSSENPGQARFTVSRPEGHEGPLTLVIAAPDGTIIEKQVQPDEEVSLDGTDGEHFELVEIRAGDLRLAHDLVED